MQAGFRDIFSRADWEPPIPMAGKALRGVFGEKVSRELRCSHGTREEIEGVTLAWAWRRIVERRDEPHMNAVFIS